MEGVAANLSQMVETRVQADPIVRARNKAEVPLATAVALMLREKLTGEAPPAQAITPLMLVRDEILEKAGGDLDALEGALRSEERRVGKECGSTGRSRWSPCHYKKTLKQKRTKPQN